MLGAYVYCAANPVKYVDPDGRDWITASYDEDIFVFYDERINSAEDIKSVYYYKDGAGGRNSYDIQYIGKSGFYNTNGNELTLNDNGTYSMNGVAHNGEYDNGGLHVGSTRYTDISKDKGVACNNNFYGNYAGGHNPKFSSGLDSYAMPPIDDLDYATFKHDKGYDEFGAKGGLSAFTDIRVIEVDYKLGYDCLKVSSNGSEYKSSSRNKIVAFSFVVTGIKEMLR